MEQGVEHCQPLSGPVRDVLEEVRKVRGESNLVFPSPVNPDEALSDMTLIKVSRDNGLSERTTVPGFRTTVGKWASENIEAPETVMELLLAHAVGSDGFCTYA